MVAAVSLQGEVRLEGGEIEVRHGAQQRKHRSECTYWRDTEATSAHCVRFCPPVSFPHRHLSVGSRVHALADSTWRE